MERELLSRYETTPDGAVVIDVAAKRIESLYHDFDRGAPYIRRDLDQELVDYLIECARELKGEPFVLRFTLDQPPDDEGEERIRHSTFAFFRYLAERERFDVKKLFRRAAILFGIGVGLLFASVSVNQLLGENRSVVANVFAEGLTVASWVSLWEALALYLTEWFPLRNNIRLYLRLANARVEFGDGPRFAASMTP